MLQLLLPLLLLLLLLLLVTGWWPCLMRLSEGGALLVLVHRQR
jgi:hypothetical protein